MIAVDKGFITSVISKQSVTDRIRSYNNGTFPCVSVDISIMFDNYQTFANFVEILYAYKSKDITLFYATKLKLFKSRKKPLIIINLILLPFYHVLSKSL